MHRLNSSAKDSQCADRDVTRLVEQFEQMWQRGEAPEASAFLAQFETIATPELVEVLLVDQQARWQRGERPRVEAYLDRYPTLRRDADAMLDLVYGEYLLAEQAGESPDLEELARRFPEVAAALRTQVDLHRAMPAADLSVPDNLTQEAALPQLSGYEFLGILGRGGMGVVYQARQVALKRLVAIKVIHDEALADPEQVRRFQVEAESLARLRHPNIVAVIEHGTQAGCQYLVMEYVEGGTLGQKFAGNPQPPQEVARMVAILAEAIHEAHTQQLVHRDLKPANILLTTDGVLKITDFGLVKRLDPSSLKTASGAMLGTPSYMAPEQVRGDQSEVGPATDVHALGMILYELLTGQRPFAGQGTWDLLTRIKEEEPLPPRRLRAEIPRDLEQVCLKCLAKEPRHRYASAAALGEELRRFLAGETVTARPLSPAARGWRWCRRKPAVASLLAGLLLSLLTGLGVALTLWRLAESQREHAETNLSLATANFELAQAKRVEAEQHLNDSRLNYQLAREAVDSYSLKVSEDPRLREGFRLLRQDLLKTAVPFYERLIARYGTNLEVEADLGRALQRLGFITSEVADPTDAVLLLERSRDIAARLLERDLTNVDLAVLHAKTLHYLGTTYGKVARSAEAIASLRQALAAWEELEAIQPTPLYYLQEQGNCRNDLAMMLPQQGPPSPEMRELLEVNLALRQRLAAEHTTNLSIRFELAIAHTNLGNTLLQQAAPKSAESHLLEALNHFEAVHKLAPTVSLYQRELSRSHMSVGALYLSTRRGNQAVATVEEAARGFRQLTARHPEVTEYRGELAGTLLMLGGMLNQTGQSAKARHILEETLPLCDELADTHSTVFQYALQRGMARINLAATYLTESLPAEAIPYLNRAIADLEALREKGGAKSPYLRDPLARGYTNRCFALRDLGKYAEAIHDADLALGYDLGSNRLTIRFARTTCRVRLGQHAQAMQEVDDILRQQKLGGREHYRLASIPAQAVRAVGMDADLASDKQRELSDGYARRTLDLLNKSLDLKYDARTAFKTDKDFAAVRDRPEFQKWLAETNP